MITKANPGQEIQVLALPFGLSLSHCPTCPCQLSGLRTTRVGSAGSCCVLPCEVGGGISLCVLRPQGIIHILEVLQVGELRDATGQHLEEERRTCPLP